MHAVCILFVQTLNSEHKALNSASCHIPKCIVPFENVLSAFLILCQLLALLTVMSAVLVTPLILSVGDFAVFCAFFKNTLVCVYSPAEFKTCGVKI